MMQRSRWTAAFAMMLALTLSACGGGGGGVNFTPAPPAAPTAPPPPAPATGAAGPLAAPAQTASPAPPVAVAGGPTFDNPAPGTVFPLIVTAVRDQAQGRFGGDPSTTSTGATLRADGASGQLRLVADNAFVDRIDALIMDPGSTGGVTDDGWGLRIVSNASAAPDDLDYTRYGTWALSTFTQSFIGGAAWTGGYVTPASAIPTVGTATYVGQVTGFYDESGYCQCYSAAHVSGNVRVSADFASGSISGAMTDLALQSSLNHSTLNELAFSASLDASRSLFTGTMRVTTTPGGASAFGANATGDISGRFFGPTANEVGAAWTLSDGAHRMIGSFGASRTGP